MIVAESNKILQALSSEILAPIVVAVVTLVGLWIKEGLKKTKVFSVRIDADKNQKIRDTLGGIRVMFKAQRAYLSMFHNGSYYVEGSEILKYSRTHESYGNGISEQAENYRDILISWVPEEMDLVDEKGPSFTTTESLPDGKLRRKLDSIEVKAICRCPVKKGEKIIGFIGLDYVHSIEPPQNISELPRYAGVVEEILSSYNKK